MWLVLCFCMFILYLMRHGKDWIMESDAMEFLEKFIRDNVNAKGGR